MGNTEEREQSEQQLKDMNDTLEVGSSLSKNHSAPMLWSQAAGATSGTYRTQVGAHSVDAESPISSYVYALGRVEPRFPNQAVDQEFRQVVGRTLDTDGKTDEQLFYPILSHPENRYLARLMCWVLTIENIDHYILRLQDPADLGQLLFAIKSDAPINVDAVVGVRGPLSSPDMCNGLILPIVEVDQIYSFNVDELVEGIRKKVTQKYLIAKAEAEGRKMVGAEDKKEITQQIARKFGPAPKELFKRILKTADNAGETDEHRALNYLAVRHENVYEKFVDALDQNCSLTAIDTRLLRLSGARKVVDVIFSFTHRKDNVVAKWFARVDVTEEFPFLVTSLSPYYDRSI